MCALTAGTQKGIWTYLAEHDGPFKAAEVAKVKEIDPPLLCKPLSLRSLIGIWS